MGLGLVEHLFYTNVETQIVIYYGLIHKPHVLVCEAAKMEWCGECLYILRNTETGIKDSFNSFSFTTYLIFGNFDFNQALAHGGRKAENDKCQFQIEEYRNTLGFKSYRSEALFNVNIFIEFLLVSVSQKGNNVYIDAEIQKNVTIFFLTIEQDICYEGCKLLGFLLPKPQCLSLAWNL